MGTPTPELTWCTTQKDEYRADIKINNEVTRLASANGGFKLLGTFVTFDNSFDVEIENRLTRSSRSFHASWDMFGCTSVPLSKR